MENYRLIAVKDIPITCAKCGGRMVYLHSGIHGCVDCGNLVVDDFGKVKEYLEEHGPTPAIIISEETGVDIGTIDGFLRSGRVEIPENSNVYIKCERCGCDIRYGRYCPECVLSLSKQLQKAFLAEEVGERPKHKAGKMHYLDKREM